MSKRLLLPLMAIAMALLLVAPSGASAHSAHMACAPIDLAHGAPSDPSCADVPSFKASFLNRVWSFDGNVDAVDLGAHTLDMTTTGIENLPARFSNQDDALLDQDTKVRFNDNTRIYGPDGKRVTADYLPYAESVVVRGKLVAPKNWASDDNGDALPTLRAKRIYITQYVEDAANGHDSSGDDLGQPAQTDPGTADPAADPTPNDGTVTSSDVKIWIEIRIEVHARS
jgi:hypothetical protein